MNLDQLRARAVRHTLFAAAGPGEALPRLGFVQADPIRAPARAQDLIFRHRVADYRAGDLNRWYPSAPVDEGYLYAYGYLPSATWELLRPRHPTALTELERDVLTAVREAAEPVHPRQLDADFGRERAANDWGGHSRVTKLALERLHRLGLLRVAERAQNVRCYRAAPIIRDTATPAQRLWSLIPIVARVLAPVLEKTLLSIAARLRKKVTAEITPRAAVTALYESGELVKHRVEGLTYAWPSDATALSEPAEPERRVRFLAPFDPLVWDRQRFEHLWGWAYRFEAYTPVAQRVRGYYALPLLLGDRVVGWANASRSDTGLQFELGFVEAAPTDAAFGDLVDAEVASLERFLRRRPAAPA